MEGGSSPGSGGSTIRCRGGPLVFDDGYHKFSIIMHMLGT